MGFFEFSTVRAFNKVSKSELGLTRAPLVASASCVFSFR